MKDTVRGYRRILVDMHIPDWDRRFLASFDPVRMADLYDMAGVDSVMFYCQSHVGLCYWPTESGKMHAGLRGRDVVAETLRLLRTRGLFAGAYYSVVYNNWAFLEHPEWRIVPSIGISEGSFAGHRYGHCCPNNPGYREFVMRQIEELIGGYRFDSLFVDMTFWPAICVCEHCREKLRCETGLEIPEVINWLSTDWCTFQSSRERWISEFAGAITAKAKSVQPDLTVNHNFASSIFNWTLGLPLESAVHNDSLGADFYGDALEQLMVIKMMLNCKPGRSHEFQTSLCSNLSDHVQLRSTDTLKTQAFAATLFGSGFMFIDAINPDGTANPSGYSRIREIYDKTRIYEPHLGGTSVEDIAVYFSGSSKMDFAENGTSISEAPMWINDYPHSAAVRGVCRILQQEHLPFGVITKWQLSDLDRYKVLVLPNVLRTDREEVEAFRDYVRRGGKIYASRYTSLTETSGLRHNDFMLADVFGCSFLGDDLGRVNYLNPIEPELADAIAPQLIVSHFALGGEKEASSVSHTRMLRLADNGSGRSLATLSLPYASPESGTVYDQSWASIHSSPPWEHTGTPAIVENRFGDGCCIYSAADIECVDSSASKCLFKAILHRLMDTPPTYAAQAHPSVWMNVMHQPERRRFVIGFLNFQEQLPAVPVRGIRFTLRPPAGSGFERLSVLPNDEDLAFTVDDGGAIQAEVPELGEFCMIAAEYSAERQNRFGTA